MCKARDALTPGYVLVPLTRDSMCVVTHDTRQDHAGYPVQ
jgi:hypothetical protein